CCELRCKTSGICVFPECSASIFDTGIEGALSSGVTLHHNSTCAMQQVIVSGCAWNILSKYDEPAVLIDQHADAVLQDCVITDNGGHGVAIFYYVDTPTSDGEYVEVENEIIMDNCYVADNEFCVRSECDDVMKK